jgi:hypothetical protein
MDFEKRRNDNFFLKTTILHSTLQTSKEMMDMEGLGRNLGLAKD